MALYTTGSNPSRQHVYEVTELNKKIKRILEETFPLIGYQEKYPTSGSLPPAIVISL